MTPWGPGSLGLGPPSPESRSCCRSGSEAQGWAHHPTLRLQPLDRSPLHEHVSVISKHASLSASVLTNVEIQLLLQRIRMALAFWDSLNVRFGRASGVTGVLPSPHRRGN